MKNAAHRYFGGKAISEDNFESHGSTDHRSQPSTKASSEERFLGGRRLFLRGAITAAVAQVLRGVFAPVAGLGSEGSGWPRDIFLATVSSALGGADRDGCSGVPHKRYLVKARRNDSGQGLMQSTPRDNLKRSG